MYNQYEETITFDEAMRHLVDRTLTWDPLYIERKEGIVAVSDSVWVVVGPEANVWPVLRHLPAPLPSGEGAWKCESAGPSEVEFEDAKPILDTVDVSGKPASTATLTDLLVETNHHGLRFLNRAVWAENRYWFVSDDFTPLLKECRQLWFTPGKNDIGVFWGERTSDVRVMVLPLKPGSVDDRYLRPYEEAKAEL